MGADVDISLSKNVVFTKIIDENMATVTWQSATRLSALLWIPLLNSITQLETAAETEFLFHVQNCGRLCRKAEELKQQLSKIAQRRRFLEQLHLPSWIACGAVS
ncbi:conserved hypothetical protein [Ricinus communis]|uniref:Uncharacterized protein n=1 Tax=Ricinus communis TaxID=3988 RepID=B9SRX6_RICCO|nr:conserved hypothetical protein [Ricinus communis]